MAVFNININDILQIYDDEFNHEPLMIAHQICVRLLILDEQQTSSKYTNRILIFQLV